MVGNSCGIKPAMRCQWSNGSFQEQCSMFPQIVGNTSGTFAWGRKEQSKERLARPLGSELPCNSPQGPWQSQLQCSGRPLPSCGQGIAQQLRLPLLPVATRHQCMKSAVSTHMQVDDGTEDKKEEVGTQDPEVEQMESRLVPSSWSAPRKTIDSSMRSASLNSGPC